MKIILKRIKKEIEPFVARRIPFVNRRFYQAQFKLTRIQDTYLGISPYQWSTSHGVEDLRMATLRLIESLKIEKKGSLLGYRYSNSSTKATLYSLVSAILLKNLYGETNGLERDLELLVSFQHPDGLFRDPLLPKEVAESTQSWGTYHLTLHSLMALALCDTKPKYYLEFLKKYYQSESEFEDFLKSRNWGEDICETSNEIQNLGFFLQFQRDYLNEERAQSLLNKVYEHIEAHQDPQTGLYGNDLKSSEGINFGIQTGYHFWMLYFYDRKKIPFAHEIVESILSAQNWVGGFGPHLNSSACEDIDSIDPLVRLRKMMPSEKQTQIDASLNKAFSWYLTNLNADGGFVFRRHSANYLNHPQLFSAPNESNLFYTWFRTLGLAYCLQGIQDVPSQWRYDWNFKWAPGHQFFNLHNKR